MNALGRRPPLLLLPGILCDQAVWAAQAEALGDVADVHVATLDGDTIVQMAEGVLASAPARFALAGFSMGGYVALEIISRQPQRVSRLCLANTNARADTSVQQEGRAALIALAQARGVQVVAARLTPLVLHRSRRSDALLTSAVEAMMARVSGDRFIQQQRAVAGRADHRRDLAGIEVPTCIITSDADAVSAPELAAEMAAAIPGARLHRFSDCGHMAPLEVPDQVTVALRDWLALPEATPAAFSSAIGGQHFELTGTPDEYAGQ